MSAFTRFFALIIAFFTMIFNPGKTYEVRETVKAMTYNISCDELTDERLDAVKQQIEYVSPDVFGLQEIKSSSKSYIAKELKKYSSVTVSDMDIGNETYIGIYWLNEKYDKISSGSIYLSKTPNIVSKSWDARHTRMMVWTLLENKETGFKFIAADTHLDHVGATARAESLKLIDKTLKQFDCPVIVVGDFNCRYTGAELPVFTDLGWVNTINLSGVNKSTDTFHNYDGSDANHSPIDHIFVNKAESATNWQVHKEKYNGRYPSDHFALSVEITFNSKLTAKQNYELIKNS